MSNTYNYETFLVSFPAEYVAHVEINRPEKLNSFKESYVILITCFGLGQSLTVYSMWLNLEKIFDRLSADPSVRSVVLSGKGDKAFTAGLDVCEFETIWYGYTDVVKVESASQSETLGGNSTTKDVGRRAFAARNHILEFQRCISSIERCQKRE
jgi:delta(3,5)-delta(2,4)-dienoyl-CoA isomerase